MWSPTHVQVLGESCIQAFGQSYEHWTVVFFVFGFVIYAQIVCLLSFP